MSSIIAAQTKKLWKPNETLKVYFFGGQDARTQRVLEYASIWSKHCSIKFIIKVEGVDRIQCDV